MEEEVNEASNTESGLILQFDGNLWAGEGIIQNRTPKQKWEIVPTISGEKPPSYSSQLIIFM